MHRHFVQFAHDAQLAELFLQGGLEIKVVSLGIHPGVVLAATLTSRTDPEHEKHHGEHEEDCGCRGEQDHHQHRMLLQPGIHSVLPRAGKGVLSTRGYREPGAACCCPAVRAKGASVATDTPAGHR